jgi:hypothetical protein
MWHADDLDDITRHEAAAVEAEDFEAAASLSAKADAAKARLASLEQAVRAAEAACAKKVGLCQHATPPLRCAILMTLSLKKCFSKVKDCVLTSEVHQIVTLYHTQALAEMQTCFWF